MLIAPLAQILVTYSITIGSMDLIDLIDSDIVTKVGIIIKVCAIAVIHVLL
jgi:hypothetical protein